MNFVEKLENCRSAISFPQKNKKIIRKNTVHLTRQYELINERVGISSEPFPSQAWSFRWHILRTMYPYGVRRHGKPTVEHWHSEEIILTYHCGQKREDMEKSINQNPRRSSGRYYNQKF
ncbi:hypothetical protein RvY_18202 [Ramazzottius varieornatus]|uniref:Uncharacterized protein n=1 Tax=Ramazzottius varieornatus TaxID=947166 RepID=A0A1D1W5F6_RAMVA|nr:hypothetical protein RvY_18202 [Ramazzottius varieornatus]